MKGWRSTYVRVFLWGYAAEVGRSRRAAVYRVPPPASIESNGLSTLVTAMLREETCIENWLRLKSFPSKATIVMEGIVSNVKALASDRSPTATTVKSERKKNEKKGRQEPSRGNITRTINLTCRVRYLAI